MKHHCNSSNLTTCPSGVLVVLFPLMMGTCGFQSAQAQELWRSYEQMETTLPGIADPLPRLFEPGEPALGHKGNVYLQYYDRLKAWDAVSGTSRGTYLIESPFSPRNKPQTPIVSRDDIVVIAAEWNTAIAVDGSDCSELWTSSNGYPMALGVDNVLYLYAYPTLTAVNVQTGLSLWSMTLPSVKEVLITSDNRLICIGGRSVAAVDPATQRILWSRDGDDLPLDFYNYQGFIEQGNGIGPGGRVILRAQVPGYRTKATALDSVTGGRLWTTSFSKVGKLGPVSISSYSGGVFCFPIEGTAWGHFTWRGQNSFFALYSAMGTSLSLSADHCVGYRARYTGGSSPGPPAIHARFSWPRSDSLWKLATSWDGDSWFDYWSTHVMSSDGVCFMTIWEFTRTRGKAQIGLTAYKVPSQGRVSRTYWGHEPWMYLRGNAQHTGAAPSGPPQILKEPKSMRCEEGDPWELMTLVDGAFPRHYDLYKNDTIYSSYLQGPYYVDSVATLSDRGVYRMEVSNSQGSIATQDAYVRVVPKGAPLLRVNGQTVVRDEITFGVIDQPTVTLSTTFPQGRVFYSVDGSEPSNHSIEYQEPIVLSQSTSIRAIAFTEDMETWATDGPWSINVVDHPQPPPRLSVTYTDTTLKIIVSDVRSTNSCVIEVSNNLVDWVPVYTNSMHDVTSVYSEALQPATAMRFYRGLLR